LGWRNLRVWDAILIRGQHVGPGNIDSYQEAKIYLLAARSNEIHSLPALSSSCRKQIEKQYTKILTKVVFFIYIQISIVTRSSGLCCATWRYNAEVHQGKEEGCVEGSGC